MTEDLELRLGHTFADRSLFERALTHRSWCAENGGPESNERLEFLGDAVLGLAIAEFTYAEFSDHPEGQLAKIRAAVVSAPALVDVARELDLGPHLLLGRGEKSSGGQDKPSILADATEALIGAIFVDGGWDSAREVVAALFGDRVQVAAQNPGFDDWKTQLQEFAAQRSLSAPDYEIDEEGPDHAKRFSALVRVDDQVVGRGTGGSKKEAEQGAAQVALADLRGHSRP